MEQRDKMNRRDFLVQTAGAASTATALTAAVATPAHGQTPPPAGSDSPPIGFVDQQTFKDNWPKPLRDIVKVDLVKWAPELSDPAVQERHRIYSYLLMKLIHRFWNGNLHGPVGFYPRRAKQLAEPAPAGAPGGRYRGDMIANPDLSRINWDRYLGHNIACIAVDGNGEIMDFDFNHNALFRSSAEHAESRMVRRLFSLTNVFDGWKTGRAKDKPPAASLNEITLYTSLESCAQCSGVMALAGVKQIIYLQNDFSQYMIGNIMFNLSVSNKGAQGAPVPIPGSAIGLEEFQVLNKGNLDFVKDLKNGNPFFISQDGSIKDFPDPPITSFLCTDDAYDAFTQATAKFDTMTLQFPERRFPNQVDGKNHAEILTNDQCLKHAREFFKYVDNEGFRGSPHKL
jgi:tRNA(Arg) A34 adenosine deaminase TadA